MTWLIGLGLLGAAYLLGSIPTGFLIAKAVKGIDIREHGSGSTGATNVLRVVGREAGLAVLCVDLLKGATAVLLVRWLAQTDAIAGPTDRLPWLTMLVGLLVLVGHSRSIWLGFTGGKSAATGLGVILALAWPVGLGAAVVFATVLVVSRMVSLSSILAAVSISLLMLLTHQPLAYLLLAIAGSLYVILRHRSNIERLLAGTEPKLGQTKPS
ncbi:glycerol-3-phosphate 1-O-acyltransferase PlsY [Romeria aff. gracilis LEGE 07310]|uniref:Glycerol-3-phosphate acyltransferase n=1 Tax=Vasconcelosia minhoensis LEGE 07310 TaxID=915328 RepID=A0A8J7AW34_9CYAN|nr:glycerol-3-phosphate 1-O-acyltransferase PlsY [Romeria gracilis]MBE9078153.1 glycerol-3-phosphate 1-O-acyltransferase PlsY [Romeria aff. gracilis LEGE 07310]